jgi:hypothetical protein
MECADAAIDEFSDQNEKAIMARFLIGRAIPFAEYWAYGLDAVEGGATLTINPADWPRWTEED